MRADSAAFNDINTALSKSPRYVVALSFDRANTDILYITSHAATPVPDGATALQGLLSDVGGTTQRINPETGVSEIGAISFSVLDKERQLSILAATKLGLGYGLRRKRVVIYVGYDGLAWDEFQVVSTQIVDDITQSGSLIKISCADIQRAIKDQIFDVKRTNLSASISATATLIPVYSTTGFQTVAHGSSYTDAPGASVGYIRIDKEVIRWTSTTADPVLGLCFVADQRGALNTYAAAHEVDASSVQDRRPEVTEVVYLELPTPKMVLALLTGTLYNQGGARLPDGWHLGIDSTWVRTADFVNIGADWWNPANDTNGLIFRFVGEKMQEGKKFIESQIMKQIGAYMPIYSNGEIGLIRTTSILSDAAHVMLLDESNCVNLPDVRHSIKEVRNIYSIKWNWDHIEARTTRDSLLVDSSSININDLGAAQIMECRGLHGSRHTPDTIATMFDRMRDRFSGPPLRLSLSLLHRMNRIEVGDVVRVRLANVTDLNTGASIDRAFEVQQVSVDWVTGKLKVELFGSSQKAGAIASSSPTSGPALSDSWYSSGGAVALATYPGITKSIVGGVLRITGGHLSGAATFGAAKFYHVGDVQFDSNVTFSSNVMLAVAGHLQINATLDGKGRGLAGSSTGYGVAGNIGTTLSWGSYTAAGAIINTYGLQVSSPVSTAPLLALSNASGVLSGVENVSMLGTSGSKGADVIINAVVAGTGGAGGNGGAAMAIVCRGLSFGASGKIDTSGNDGIVGHYVIWHPYTFGTGSGAGGAPSGLYVLLDGDITTVPVPDINDSTFRAFYGIAPTLGATNVSYPGWALTLSNSWQSFSRIQYIPSGEAAVEDARPIAAIPLGLTLTLYQNLPKTPDGSKSSVDAAVARPSDSSYSYANIYYRKLGTTPWTYSGAAADELSTAFSADGSTYEFEARSVSLSGEESLSGVRAQITLNNGIRTAPPTPANFYSTRSGVNIRFTWEYDPTVKSYEIRRGSSWDGAVVLARPYAPPFDVASAVAGTYMIKAVDIYGVYSIGSATVIVSEYTDINLVINADEATGGWAGVTTSVAASSAGVTLAGTKPLSHFTQPISSYTKSIALESVISTTGSYETVPIDAGAILTSRVEIDAAIEQVPLGSPISSWTNPLNYYGDGWTLYGPIGITSAFFEISTSDDGATWSPWRPFVVGDYTFRHIKFRITLSTDDIAYNVKMTSFLVKVDLPDREIVFNDESIPAGGKTIYFTPAFYITPSMSFAIQNGSRGDTLQITAKTNISAYVELFDRFAVTKSGVSDITARGY